MKKLISLALLIPLTAFANEAERYNIIRFNVQASQVIQRDTMQVTLQIQEQGANRQAISNTVTQRSNAVLKEIHAHKNITVTSTDRQSYQTYNRKDKPAWQDRETISLESQDFATLSALIAKVQNNAQIQNQSFTVSKKERLKWQQTLTKQAIEAFRQRANNITHALGSTKYRIVNMDIGSTATGGSSPYPMMLARSAPPALNEVQQPDSGKDNIQINISGSIQVE